MSMQTAVGLAVALAPVIAILGLLEWANRAARRREAVIGRQIALTDAIHRELGAVVAPEVSGSATRGWIVSVGVALRSESMVAAVARITDELFRRLDAQDPPRVRLMLIARPPVHALHAIAPSHPRVPAQLGRAA